MTDKGFFVGLTNQRTRLPPAEAKISRGAVVNDMLDFGNAAAASNYLRNLNLLDHNPFNLIYGNKNELFAAYAHQNADGIVIQKLGPGVHVLPNGTVNDMSIHKVRRIQELLADKVDAPWPELQNHLRRVLADSSPAPLSELQDFPDWLSDWRIPLSAIFVNTTLYGTRSSSILAQGRNLEVYYSMRLNSQEQMGEWTRCQDNS